MSSSYKGGFLRDDTTGALVLSVDTGGLTATTGIAGSRPVVDATTSPPRVVLERPGRVHAAEPRFNLPTDGSTDATAALHAARNAAGAGGTVELPPWVVIVDNFTPLSSQVFDGCGFASELRWKAGATRAVDIQGVRDIALSNLSIDGNGTTTAAELLRIIAATDGSTGTQALSLDNVRVRRTGTGVAGLAVRDSGFAANQSDKVLWRAVAVSNCGIGYLMECPNGQNHEWEGGYFSGCGVGVSAKAGTATFKGTQWQTCTIAGVRFDGANVQSLAFDDVYMEGNPVDITSLSSDGLTHYWAVRGVRATHARLASDVVIGANGSLRAEQCEFRGNVTLSAANAQLIDGNCRWNGAGLATQLVMSGTNATRVAFSNTSPYFTLTGNGNQLLSTEAPAGKTSEIRLGSNGVTTAFQVQTTTSENQSQFLCNGQTVLRLSGFPGGATGAALAVGANDFSAIGLFAVGASASTRRAVIARAHASQANPIVEVQDSGSVALGGFSKGGYFFTRKKAAPADADVATSEAQLWLDDTVGATKLMIKAKDSAGNVRTAAIALA